MLNEEELKKEIKYKAVRSSGSGGQHVNKVSTKVELHFSVQDSENLTHEQKEVLLDKLSNRLSNDGLLIMSSGKTRSQLKNKNVVTLKFFDLLYDLLQPKKKRKPTKLPKHIKIERLKQKRKHAEKKANRKPPSVD